MKRTARFPRQLVRWTSVIACLALLVSAVVGGPFAKNSRPTRLDPRNAQQNDEGRRVAPLPPRTGPPGANLPNLDEVKHRATEAPRTPEALPSLMRSRRKPLESRNGRRVGDPLPPILRPTPLATPTALPSPTALPTPPLELARLELFTDESTHYPPFRYFVEPSFVFGLPTPLSDSSTPLFSASKITFDVTAAPIPQAGGAKIVFTSSRDGSRQIYVMNSDGSGQMRLTTDGSNNDHPRWSPNGTKILFQSDRDNPETGNNEIYVMNADGSGQTRLTNDANDDCAASWSADGTKIVFQSFRNGVSYQIYTMNADGSGQVNISNNGVNDIQPSWSPDGTKIAFASDRDQTGLPSVYVMNANGTNQTRLTFSGTGLRDEQPVWSPNGTKIAFTSTRDSTTESWTETDDFEIPEDDGQTFPRSRLNINKEVYVMNPDGSGQTRLTNALGNDDSPTWSPDGAKIVFHSDRERDSFDPTAQLWTMNADGSGQTNLSNGGDGDYRPSWTSGSANQSPVPVPGGPYSGVVGQNAPFNGGGSYDPDGSIVSYAWTFGDGGSGSGVAPTHAYGTTGTFNVTLTVTDNLGAQATASTTINVSASSSDQYVTSFLQWGLGRPPNANESSYWTDIFRAAYPKGLSSMKLATRELGMTVFESAEYAARGRSDHWYVYDLYKAFLMREPDAEGWADWEAAIPIYGRDQIRRGFDESTEFANIVATLTASGSPSANVSSLATAQVDPFNQSGNQLQARDTEWSANLLSLPGRAGLDLGLSISYSSLVFTRSGPYSYFDADSGSPSPGFHIGFPTIQDRYFDAQVGANVYLLKTAAGRRIELRQVGTSDVYESADSSYLQLIYSGNLLLRTTDGTQMTFGWTGINEYRCIEIKDRNGNYIAVSYDWRGDIQNVTDTLGRVITFIYDANANLNRIEQTWAGQPEPHQWATFGWDNLTMQPTITGVVGTYGNEVIPVLKMVGFDDGTYTKFLYNGNGQVTRVTQYAPDEIPDHHPRNYTIFDYDSATTDCPRLNATRTWAEHWTGLNGVPAEVTTQFGVEGDKHVLTAPDGTVYKERYAGVSPASWQKGLVIESEVSSGGVQQKLSTIAWTQDNPNLSYKTNPRAIETNVYDSSGNRRRTTIDYSIAAYAQYGLPYFVAEYAADGVTEMRRAYRDYNLSQAYLDRRIIGLVSAVHLTGAGGYQTKVTYGYDDPARLNPQATTAIMHDQSYDASFTVRGNVTSVSRWDVTDINNASKALTTTMNYNAAGSVVSTADPAGHANSINYADSFSADGVNLDSPRPFSTFAYPTTITDADGFSSSIRYKYEFGAKTRIEGPPPQNQPNGVIQTFVYDSAARIDRMTMQTNGAYTQFYYGPYYIQSYSSVNTVAANYQGSDLYGIQVFDGLGRVTQTAGNHPGSTGGYKAQITRYDRMGRAVQQSNPTEIDSSWNAVGDDASGYQYNVANIFDWKGRATRIHNMDGTYKEASYSGCGCAGGEVVTLTDEVGRRQKVYSDVLGRQWKTEVLNWNGSVYSTTTNTLNARDQVTLIRQYAGTDQSSTYQDTTMSYDGYGRLQSKHAPEQNAGTATVYVYNSDDTIQSVTDARGASATYVYNNRHLVTSIAYTPSSGVTATAPVSYVYDAAGNRTSMKDGLGSKSYSYNQFSQLMSETRTFNDPNNTAINGVTKTLSYDFNLAGELKRITDSTNMTINYGFDSTGRLSSVTGSDNLFMGISNYASNFQYRAWGGLKAMTDGKGFISSLTYNSKLQPSSFEISSNTVTQTYEYFNDGRISVVHNTTDQNFDRGYSYDHAGRLTQATSGGNVNGYQYGSVPYHETFGYDAFSNLTARQSESWNGQTVDFDSASYVNNRRGGWGHDADGRNTTIGSRAMTFDAAGRRTQMTAQQVLWNGNQITVNQSTGYDGDGLRVSEVASGVSTYYLRSSVLGGAIVEELNSSGQKNVGYVTLPGGQLLATQRIQTPDQIVTWKHNTPAGTSEYTFNTYNTAIGRTEFDPLGANISLTQPPEPPPPQNEGDIGQGHFGGIMDARWSDFFNLDSGFVVDGQSVSSNHAMFFVNFGTGNSWHQTGGMSAEAFANAVIQSLGPAAFAPAGVSTIRINVSGLEAIPGRQTIEWQWVQQDGAWTFAPIPTAYSGVAAMAVNPVTLSASFQPQNSYDPRADFRDYAKQLSNKTSFTNDCQKLALLIYKAGQVWGRDGSDAIVTGLLSGLTELSSIGRTGTTLSDPNFRVGVLSTDPHFARSFDQRGFNGSYDGGGFINDFRDNQVRHFVGWFAAGYSTDWAFAEAALFAQEGTLRNRDPDVALGRAGISLGGSFSGDFRKLAQDVWSQICGEKTALNLP
jgi:Tol biopolymer transport system component